MYKTRRRVDRSPSGNRWKKGLVWFSCLCWELGLNCCGMGGCGLPALWAVVRGSSPQVEVRFGQGDMDWVMQSCLVLEQQIFLLVETLLVLGALRSFSGQLGWR